jgi:hypothetical protein
MNKFSSSDFPTCVKLGEGSGSGYEDRIWIGINTMPVYNTAL